MAIKKDPKTGQFVKGHKSRGRPAGSGNFLKLKSVLTSADKNAPDAIQFLIDVFNGNIKGASVTNRQAAAIKIIDLALKNKELTDKEQKALEDLKGESKDSEEDSGPIISLTAVK